MCILGIMAKKGLFQLHLNFGGVPSWTVFSLVTKINENGYYNSIFLNYSGKKEKKSY